MNEYVYMGAYACCIAGKQEKKKTTLGTCFWRTSLMQSNL